jgi:membrane protein required for colicin V production
MIIDIIAAIIISLGFYLGYQRGLIKTVFDTLSLMIGILAALKLSPWVIDALQSMFNLHKAVTLILGIVITFIGVMMLIRFIGRKFEDLLEVANINIINKFSGGGVQAIFFAAILSYAVAFLSKLQVFKPETINTSFSYNYLMKMPELSSKLFSAVKPVFIDFWNKTNDAMNDLKKQEEQ